MNSNLWQSFMQWVDQRIAEKLREWSQNLGLVSESDGTPGTPSHTHTYTVDNIQGRPITTDVPNVGDVLQWSGSLWVYVPLDLAGALFIDASGETYLDASDAAYTAG